MNHIGAHAPLGMANQSTLNMSPLPALSQVYETKEEFLQSAAEAAAMRGFKFYVAEGRAASHNPRTNKVELACSKFRVYDGRGGKTRHGGCKFAITIRKQPADTQGEPVWKVVSANYQHNHELGPPTKPKPFTPRPRSASPPSRRAANSWHFGPPGADNGSFTPRASQPMYSTGAGAVGVDGQYGGTSPPSQAGYGGYQSQQASMSGYAYQGNTATAKQPQYAGLPPLSSLTMTGAPNTYGAYGSTIDDGSSIAGRQLPPLYEGNYQNGQQGAYHAQHLTSPVMYTKPLSRRGSGSQGARRGSIQGGTMLASSGSTASSTELDPTEAALVGFFRDMDPTMEPFAGWFHWLGVTVEAIREASDAHLRSFVLERLGPCVPEVPHHQLQKLLDSLLRYRSLRT